ncbi:MULTISPECIES: alpha/beta hydrolase [Paenibacillus]|uniref:Alpha/beta fold hydrolase n=1 Tax=Paenibacillus validus TaxID=44253 RepID=A0A7X2ZE56_9BACL|nr:MULTISPECIES: alpha/beta hydrolase [Paenibacillus]MUG73273.1 alpha/beta fold hydrolase [Paenibacillus validus]
MISDDFTFNDTEGVLITVHRWLPEEGAPVKAVVQIAHGLAERAQRYARLADKLTRSGYAVYANDHRGHGLTAGTPDRVTHIGPNGFDRMAEAMVQLTDRIRLDYPGLPVYVLGHSMGSFLTLLYMERYPGKADGFVLSGTKGKQTILHGLGFALGGLFSALQGGTHRNRLLNWLTTGQHNLPFRPNRTRHDWLSRDEAEVDAYAGDPLCNAAATNECIRYMIKGLLDAHRPEQLRRIPKSLPVYLFAGERDPVGGMGKSFLWLVRELQSQGLHDVSYKLYPDGRHEMLNETNREEVMEDLLQWLEARVNAVSARP